MIQEALDMCDRLDCDALTVRVTRRRVSVSVRQRSGDDLKLLTLHENKKKPATELVKLDDRLLDDWQDLP